MRKKCFLSCFTLYFWAVVICSVYFVWFRRLIHLHQFWRGCIYVNHNLSLERYLRYYIPEVVQFFYVLMTRGIYIIGREKGYHGNIRLPSLARIENQISLLLCCIYKKEYNWDLETQELFVIHTSWQPQCLYSSTPMLWLQPEKSQFPWMFRLQLNILFLKVDWI